MDVGCGVHRGTKLVCYLVTTISSPYLFLCLQVVSRLAPYLPEEHRSPESLRDLARSPQFQQQLHTFSTALQTGQLDLAQFGLQARGFSVADFLAAIQELVDRERQQRQQ